MDATARREPRRGRHKIFLGFAAGVGKTYEMLQEANRRRQRGEDVVVGYLERKERPSTLQQVGDLEVIPLRTVEYHGARFEEMDTDAILARHPQCVAVDELAHSNVPGSAREKRWQDVQVLLDAGIDVLSTLNVQHLDSLNDVVHDITGVVVRETVPDSLLTRADEVQMIDIPPQALLNRLQRGDIYNTAEQIAQARANWFNPGNLNALREIALREVAREVDEDVTEWRKARHIRETWPTHDRIMVCISPTTSSQRLIRRGWRIAQRLHAEIVAVYVESYVPSAEERDILHADFQQASRLDIPIITLTGKVEDELVRYAREKQITQLVVGHSSRSRWQELVQGSIISTLARELRTIDILIVAAPRREPPRH